MLNHKGTITLETERLILRKFTQEDAADMFKNWASDEEVTRCLTWPSHGSIDITKKVIGMWIVDYKKPRELPMGYRTEGKQECNWKH